MLNNLDQIRRVLGDATFRTGENLAEAGFVSETRELNSGQVVTGIVSDGEPRRVYIQLSTESIDGECSCDVGENCQHVAAVLIHIRGNGTPVTLPTAGGNQRFAATAQVTARQQLQYQLEVQSVTNTCIRQFAEIWISLWVVQADGQRTPFMPQTFYAASAKDGQYPRYVQSDDLEILSDLITMAPEGSYPLRGQKGVRLLLACLATGRTSWGQSTALVEGEIMRVDAKWYVQNDGQQQLDFDLQQRNIICCLLSPIYVIDPLNACVSELISTCPADLLEQLSSRPSLAPEEAAEFNQEFSNTSGLPEAPMLTVHSLASLTPTPRLVLSGSDGAARAELYFVYDGEAFNSHQLNEDQCALRFMREGQLYQFQRDLCAEDTCRQQLSKFTCLPDAKGLTLPDKHAWLGFMVQNREDLIRQGWQLEIHEQFPYRLISKTSWYGELEVSPPDAGDMDWFTLEIGIVVDGQSVNILPLLIDQLRHYSPEALRGVKSLAGESHEQQVDQQLLLHMDDGRYLPISLQRLQKILSTLIELCDQDCLNDAGQLTLPYSQAGRLELLASDFLDDDPQEMEWRGEESVKALIQNLRQFDGIQPVAPPSNFHTELRDYQKEGVGWLQFLRKYHLGGILADDMGLGKTVQTLAHLTIEKNQGRLQQPALIVAPTSVIGNWRREALKFAPDLKILTLHGAQRKSSFDQMSDADVILTTYPLLNFDESHLLAHEYYLLVLDEAQNVKNPRARVSQIVRRINAEHRLCLTGTPMENHLGELWSLFDFLQPGLLGDERSFQRLYRGPIEKEGSEDRAAGLSKRIAPFILRRDKETVAKELPAKTEILRQIPLGETQRDLYDGIRLTMHKQIREVIEEQGFARSRIQMLDVLLKLRQVCCDPRLLDRQIANGVTQSAKFDALMAMLPNLIEEGRRILLFSQFTSMLDLIEASVAELDIPYMKLTGKSKNRTALVEEFQSGSTPLFLISLKAGGTGLNLTAADTVIHYDPWWNPAVENQATDRAHRIGQDKPVFVYKLVTEGTVEEKILYLQDRKRGLASGIFGAKTASPTQLTQEDFDHLLEPVTELSP